MIIPEHQTDFKNVLHPSPCTSLHEQPLGTCDWRCRDRGWFESWSRFETARDTSGGTSCTAVSSWIFNSAAWILSYCRSCTGSDVCQWTEAPERQRDRIESRRYSSLWKRHRKFFQNQTQTRQCKAAQKAFDKKRSSLSLTLGVAVGEFLRWVSGALLALFEKNRWEFDAIRYFYCTLFVRLSCCSDKVVLCLTNWHFDRCHKKRIIHTILDHHHLDIARRWCALLCTLCLAREFVQLAIQQPRQSDILALQCVQRCISWQTKRQILKGCTFPCIRQLQLNLEPGEQPLRKSTLNKEGTLDPVPGFLHWVGVSFPCSLQMPLLRQLWFFCRPWSFPTGVDAAFAERRCACRCRLHSNPVLHISEQTHRTGHSLCWMSCALQGWNLSSGPRAIEIYGPEACQLVCLHVKGSIFQNRGQDTVFSSISSKCNGCNGRRHWEAVDPALIMINHHLST